jgi:hypothetical protein
LNKPEESKDRQIKPHIPYRAPKTRIEELAEEFAKEVGGIEVHRAWRDEMYSQCREVDTDRQVYATLSKEDKELNAGIAAHVVVQFFKWLRGT